MKSLALAMILSVMSSATMAQEIIKPPCHQPPMPNDQSSDTVVKFFNKHRMEYQACMEKFADEQKALVETYGKTDPAKANIAHESAEAALKEYNAFVDALNAHAKAKDDE
jgi:hypothetical protein